MEKFTKAQVIEVILDRVRSQGLRQTARDFEMDAGHLCRTLNGRQQLSDEMAAKFHFERMETLYRKKP